MVMFGVAKTLLEPSDAMEVADSSKTFFIGSAKQPDMSLTLPNAPCRVLQCVKGVVELKKEGGRNQALKQVIQRRAEIASHRVEFNRLIGAIADDNAMNAAMFDSKLATRTMPSPLPASGTSAYSLGRIDFLNSSSVAGTLGSGTR